MKYLSTRPDRACSQSAPPVLPHAKRQKAAAFARLAMAAVTAFFLVRSAGALTINLTYNERESTPPVSRDPTGESLQLIMNYAASVWQSIVQDEGTLDVEYYWSDLDDASSTLALENTLGTSGGKPTEARIRFDSQFNGSDRRWYLDPAPEDGIEFNLQRVVVGDLSESQLAAWYTGTPPPTLETSYAGAAKTSSGSTVRNNYDLYSIALHELGHAVGLSPTVAPLEPLLDSDYDVPQALVEQVGGTEPFAINAHSANNLAHLAATKSLMFPSFVRGERRLPSQTDVLAIASAARWADIAFVSHVLGDMDGDGDLDFDDVEAFVLGLNHPDEFEVMYGLAPVLRGDMDQNGTFDFDDIALFSAVFGEPPAAQAVPEPASLALLVIAIGLIAPPRARGRVAIDKGPGGAMVRG